MEVAGVLTGHRAEVHSITRWEGTVLTGSADGSARLWDWPRGARSVKCLFPGAGGEVSAVAVSKKEPYRAFLASGTDVFEFDLRKENIVLRDFRWTKTLGRSSDDEINSLAVNEKGTYLAACDDAGDVAVMDLSTAAMEAASRPDLIRWKRMRRTHQNICSSVDFRGGTTWELVSGSFDCTVMRWDYGRGRMTGKVAVGDSVVESGASQMLNPPFVHCVAAEGCRRGRIAAALGSGDIVLVDVDSTSSVVARGSDVHLAAASTVCWSNDRIFSGGVDCKFVQWRTDSESGSLEMVHQVRMASTVNALAPSPDGDVYVALQSGLINVMKTT